MVSLFCSICFGSQVFSPISLRSRWSFSVCVSSLDSSIQYISLVFLTIVQSVGVRLLCEWWELRRDRDCWFNRVVGRDWAVDWACVLASNLTTHITAELVCLCEGVARREISFVAKQSVESLSSWDSLLHFSIVRTALIQNAWKCASKQRERSPLSRKWWNCEFANNEREGVKPTLLKWVHFQHRS